MVNGGDVKLLSLLVRGSGAKAALGKLSDWAVVVAHAAPAPFQETVQPTGKAGVATLSKSCEKMVCPLELPSTNVKIAVPKVAAPSCNWSVALLVAPQFPLAVKVNSRVTAEAPTVNGP